MHASHRRGSVGAGFGAIQQRFEVRSKVRREVLARLSVNARGPIAASTQVRFVQPIKIDVVSQGSEPHLGRLLRQLGYPLLSR
jgi:hypothetical protein